MKHLLMFVISVLFAQGSLLAQGGQLFVTRTVKSNILNMERNYSIYLPPGYNDTDQSYPVLYLLHGSGDTHLTGWVQFGQVQQIADKTIAEGQAAPMIIVMPNAETGVRGYYNTVDGKFNYEDFFFKEFIPHIESTYRVHSERRYRAIGGLSMGGGGTIFYALHHPEMFEAAAPLSASTGNWDWEQYKQRAKQSYPGISEDKMRAYYDRHSIESLIKNATEDQLKEIKKVHWYISCGDDDFLYEGNSKLHVLFRKNEINHEYRVKNGGHTWNYWRMELPLVMEYVSKAYTNSDFSDFSL